jgi:hypothetical protein
MLYFLTCPALLALRAGARMSDQRRFQAGAEARAGDYIIG